MISDHAVDKIPLSIKTFKSKPNLYDYMEINQFLDCHKQGYPRGGFVCCLAPQRVSLYDQQRLLAMILLSY